MANEQDTPQNELEPQGDAPAKEAAEAPPPKDKPPAEADEGDALVPKSGETVEQYAARIRGEVSWRDKQMARQYRQKKDADERLTKMAEVEAENQRLTDLANSANRKAKPDDEPPRAVPAQPAPKQTPGLSPEAMAQARFTIGVEKLGEQLNGRKEWASASRNLEAAGGIPPEVVSAVLDTDDPAHVMIQLGANMEKFQQIMDMPEGRRRAALVKIGMETAKSEASPPPPPVKKPSSAPAPRESLPSGGGAAPPGDSIVPDRDDRAPIPTPGHFPEDKYRSDEHDAAWYAARKEQKRNSQGRPWSPGNPPSRG